MTWTLQIEDLEAGSGEVTDLATLQNVLKLNFPDLDLTGVDWAETHIILENEETEIELINLNPEMVVSSEEEKPVRKRRGLPARPSVAEVE